MWGHCSSQGRPGEVSRIPFRSLSARCAQWCAGGWAVPWGWRVRKIPKRDHVCLSTDDHVSHMHRSSNIFWNHHGFPSLLGCFSLSRIQVYFACIPMYSGVLLKIHRIFAYSNVFDLTLRIVRYSVCILCVFMCI